MSDGDGLVCSRWQCAAGQRCAGGSIPRCMTQTDEDLDKVGVRCSHAVCMHTERGVERCKRPLSRRGGKQGGTLDRLQLQGLTLVL